MNSCYISLGSNVGDRYLNLQSAIRNINNTNNISIISKSSIYESEPMYYKEQRFFYNAVIEIETSYNPFKLLDIFEVIEKKIGRTNKNGNKPRIIDIDILVCGKILIKHNILTIPHENMYERSFVLIPLQEINKNFMCPSSSLKISHLLKCANDTTKITKLSKLKL